jgi:polar amino acid transport system substrate-binding protein
LRLLALLGVLALAVAACGSDDGDDASTDTTGADTPALETIKSGTLTVCSDMPYAPFEFGDPGSEEGVDVDIMRAIGEQLDLDVTFRDTDFDGIFAALAAGQCDVVASSVTITEERLENNAFTDPYFEINQSLLVREDDKAKYPDLASLKGKTIGVQSGTTGADYAKANAPDSQIKEFTGADELFTSLKAKQIEAVLQDLPVNAYHAKTTGETAVAKVFESTEKESYGFAVKKDQTILLDALNDALAEVRSSGEYDRIITKYLGEQDGATGATSTAA